MVTVCQRFLKNQYLIASVLCTTPAPSLVFILVLFLFFFLAPDFALNFFFVIAPALNHAE